VASWLELASNTFSIAWDHFIVVSNEFKILSFVVRLLLHFCPSFIET